MLVEVERLEKAMHELLGALADRESEDMSAAWERCAEAQEGPNNLLADTSKLGESEREELRAGLESLVRLNAITRQTVLHNQDGLAKNLVKAKQESAKVKAYAAGGSALGDSCDLAG